MTTYRSDRVEGNSIEPEREELDVRKDIESDCLTYYPGMLADLEEELTNCKEYDFAQQLFAGCDCYSATR